MLIQIRRTAFRVALVQVIFVAIVFSNPSADFHAVTRAAYAQQVPPDIFAFYQTALAVAQTTHAQDLTIICQKPQPDKIFSKAGNMYVSFLGGRSKKVVLAVFTKNPLNSLSAVHLDRVQNGIEWMFVFDRNRDGKIDYILWPQGVLPFVDGTPPPGFPSRGTIVHMTRQQGELIQRYAKMIFYHWADENFDGKLSAMVLEAWDPSGLFAISGWQLIRSSGFDGILDQCWYFTGDPNNKTGACEPAAQGYKTRTLDDKDIAPADLAAGSVWFSMLNDAAGACVLTSESF